MKTAIALMLALLYAISKGKCFGLAVMVRTLGNFPQGGINLEETPEQAMFRELDEEVGLTRKEVKILAGIKSMGSFINCQND